MRKSHGLNYFFYFFPKRFSILFVSKHVVQYLIKHSVFDRTWKLSFSIFFILTNLHKKTGNFFFKHQHGWISSEQWRSKRNDSKKVAMRSVTCGIHAYLLHAKKKRQKFTEWRQRPFRSMKKSTQKLFSQEGR